MKTVLFLGAGFSAAFGHPTMNHFLEEVASRTKLSDNDTSLVADLILEARRANSFLESSPTNIEDILSFAVMGDRLGLRGEDGKERAPRIKSIIGKVYSALKDEDNYWKQYRVLGNLLGKTASDWPEGLAIITTNYDLNIECALHYHNEASDYGFECTELREGQSASLCVKRGIPLLKLHGSVNWFKNEDPKGGVLVDARLIKVPAGIILPRVCMENHKPGKAPLLVPPSFLKPELDSPLPQVWQKAAQHLNQAETVAFIGYSFPPSDVEMKFFLAKSLAGNAKLQRLLVYDIEADAIVVRLKAAQSGFGSHFRDFLVSRPGEWQITKKGLSRAAT